MLEVIMLRGKLVHESLYNPMSMENFKKCDFSYGRFVVSNILREGHPRERSNVNHPLPSMLFNE